MADTPQQYSIYELDFTEADLEANRAGTVTPVQQARLTAYAKQIQQNIGWGIIVFALLIAAVVGFEFLRTGGTLELFSRRQTPITLIVIGLFFAVMVLTTIITQINTRPLKKGKITAYEGVVNAETVDAASQMGKFRVTLVTVGKARFRFYRPESAAHFEHGRKMRAYAVKMPLLPNPIPLSVERVVKR